MPEVVISINCVKPLKTKTLHNIFSLPHMIEIVYSITYYLYFLKANLFAQIIVLFKTFAQTKWGKNQKKSISK